ncbi:ornithine decarboxylase [Linnemannia elongata]|nr:ornithine decarboxylase [Linnemannia elongata]
MSLNLPRLHQLSVSDMFQSHLDSLHSNVDMDMQPKNAFYVADLGEVYRLHLRWKALLPRIEPFYALKCNPDPMVVRLLAALGAGFDCASMSEIRMMVELGVNPEKIVHANPCKETTQVKYARANNVRMSTFDNEDELLKIKDLFPESKLLLRILVDDSRSHGQFGLKFGASLDSVGPVLEVARDLGLDVVGVSFHVGSGCFDATAFGDAVVRARRVFDMAKSYGYDFKLLDVGGGFPSAYSSSEISFESIAEILGSSVNRLFEPEIRVIAEPGRYYVSSAFSLATQSRKCRSNPGPSPNTNANANATITRMYYVNDGVYGSFSGIYYDNLICDPHALLLDNQFVYNKLAAMDTCSGNHVTSVWGPTMDSADCLKREAALPLMNTGDWIYFDNMGAYTVAAASHFHGFMKSEVLYTTTEPEVSRLLELD